MRKTGLVLATLALAVTAHAEVTFTPLSVTDQKRRIHMLGTPRMMLKICNAGPSTVYSRIFYEGEFIPFFEDGAVQTPTTKDLSLAPNVCAEFSASIEKPYRILTFTCGTGGTATVNVTSEE